MKPPSRQFVLFSGLCILLLSRTPAAGGSDGGDDRQVRVAYVEGDVRLSRGAGKHVDLNKSWEPVYTGESVKQGFALATGDGRLEVAFEDGSAAYLAENSLLLFNALSVRGERNLTRMTLATGTATFSLQSAGAEDFSIETPTDALWLPAPRTFYSRVDAYLDATAVTAQGDKGETMERVHRPDLRIPKGNTIFLQRGELLDPPADRGCWPPVTESLPRHIEPWLLRPCAPEDTQTRNPAAKSSEWAWDKWVSTHAEQEKTLVATALKASGLPSPIPGLADLYEQGTFVPCEEYGTCWEPSEPEPQLNSTPQSPTPGTQSPAPNQTNSGFQPQTVQWVEKWGTCGLWRTASRVAQTPQELDKLLRFKGLWERLLYAGVFDSADCYTGYWVPRHGHYAKVITPLGRRPRKCPPRGCGLVRPVGPVWLRQGKLIGFVPRHPKDVEGKPPLNLKNGIIVPPPTPGQCATLLALDDSRKIAILGKAPSQGQNDRALRMRAVTAPEIHAYLLLETTRQSSLGRADRAPAPINYDYKSHSFTMHRNSAEGASSKPVAVGGITSHGGVASFADGHSSTYAASVSHTSAAASYSSSYSSGSSSSGGAHSSASYSSGGSSGASSHAAEGGGSSSSASSSNSSSAGGGPHH